MTHPKRPPIRLLTFFFLSSLSLSVGILFFVLRPFSREYYSPFLSVKQLSDAHGTVTVGSSVHLQLATVLLSNGEGPSPAILSPPRFRPNRHLWIIWLPQTRSELVIGFFPFAEYLHDKRYVLLEQYEDLRGKREGEEREGGKKMKNH